MANMFPVVDITVDELYKIKVEKAENDYRLTQICATAGEGYNEIIYTWTKDYDLENYRIKLPLEESVVSVSDKFPSANLYENEMAGLFGVKVLNMAFDYNNKFYRIEAETPFKKEVKEDK